jgi:orotate phosphoribosyltransferase
MKDVDDLTESAGELAERGLSNGEIADELNVSRETASWLVERAGAAPGARDDAEATGGSDDGVDVHVDWSAIGRDSGRLAAVGGAMANLLDRPGIDLVVGIEKAGVPLATVVARELGADLSTYAPRKHQWEEGDLTDDTGTFSRNFAGIRGRECVVVDDTITSGTTMTETVEAIREEGGEPVGCVVLADKRGIDAVDGVPVDSLVQVISVRGGE